ncbi:unnamed protein product [Rhizopus stolonifer]
MEDQHENKCLNSLPKVYNLINKVINGEYNNMLDTVDNYKFDPTHSESDKKAIKLLKYIINDYHANCEKPVYYADANERTPYCEYIVPIFKYFSAVYKNLSFMWCEKGLVANKQLVICLDDDQKKLMDGIGYSIRDKSERLIIECSGEVDSEHTEEDTLKLMEATSRCLKHEMSRYLSASWRTFGKRQVLAIQCVNNTITLMCSKRVEENKWCFIEQRSTIVPRDWNDRFFWVKVMEFMLKLKDLLDEQENITEELKKQEIGIIQVDAQDTIRNTLNKHTSN